MFFRGEDLRHRLDSKAKLIAKLVLKLAPERVQLTFK